MTSQLDSLAPQLSKSLEDVARLLDIPDDLADEAIAKYEAVAAWLSDEDSPLRQYEPELYPQGSFRLGTPIRPLKARDEFDIDLVCRLRIKKESTTQKDLKAIVGDRLGADAELKKIVEERRRCWQLLYGDRFHLDVLPAIADAERPGTSILLTDKELVRWQFSDPIGYANWFYGRMGPQVLQLREALAKETGASIEEIPEWRVRTPLQRAVQLLKRHRDLRFSPDADDRPTSIIITTLAAHAYSGQPQTYDALLQIVRAMPRFIENRDGKWWVANPVHPGENFADKWNEKPGRKDTFERWLREVDADLQAMRERDGAAAPDIATRRFGLGSGDLQKIKPVSEVPALADTSHAAAVPWRVANGGRVSLSAWVYPALKKGHRLWQLSARGVPKHVALKFTAETNVRAPYEVYWQVVNTGQEAAAERALRGEFTEQQRGTVRWETTAYAGTHWVEAFVVKDGVCVARSGRRYVKVWH
jgi:Adenylyl/Guanylyl and SMODS C-terminal sensor domain/Cyclic GMP-AMP synthase DncV-like, nucleotidyltransferase domain